MHALSDRSNASVQPFRTVSDVITQHVRICCLAARQHPRYAAAKEIEHLSFPKTVLDSCAVCVTNLSGFPPENPMLRVD
jgi:hypothetical protein